MATYLYNQIAWVLNNWMSLYKAFYIIYVLEKKNFWGPYKSRLYHLKAYDCKVYMLIKSKDNAQYGQKCQKLDAKVYISFLIGYKSINIYWI